jgi:hypothetical protein
MGRARTSRAGDGDLAIVDFIDALLTGIHCCSRSADNREFLGKTRSSGQRLT